MDLTLTGLVQLRPTSEEPEMNLTLNGLVHLRPGRCLTWT